MNLSVQTSAEVNSVAVIGNYLPRKCGIATFTTDLVESFLDYDKSWQCFTVAMNDKPQGYNYPDNVRFEINQESAEDYLKAAEYLNINQVDMVSLQHEFGIFGGNSGDYILKLLQELTMPVVTTLHTVLVEPTSRQKQITKKLAEYSEKLVVMSHTAVNILHTLYDIPKEQICYIPHGIPDIPFVDPNYYKEKFNLLGRKVLLTFGLLSENKGIEYVIKGLPEVVKKFPDITYIVLGATHPHVLQHEGENYRNSLKQLVKKLNLEDHVIFKNHFIPFEELCEYLAATDIYVTPYNNEDQITSGTLAYASGTGTAVVSTPYWYAKEMLSDGRGKLVPFKNEKAISEAVIDLFVDDNKRHKMRKRAYDFNRHSTWKEVAAQHKSLFEEIKSDQAKNPQPFVSTEKPRLVGSGRELPPISLKHLMALTDNTGLLQHAKFSIPDREHGYCTDDNARALIFTILAGETSALTQAEKNQLDILSDRYLSFLLHAYNSKHGRFRNFMTYSRKWLHPIGSEDSHGRTLWALGTLIRNSNNEGVFPLTGRMFTDALHASKSFDSPRAIAFSLIGVEAYLKSFPGDSHVRQTGAILADQLFEKFVANYHHEWPWPEDILTYSNGKLPHALIVSGDFLQRDDMVSMGMRSLEWLIKIQTDNPNQHLSPVGNDGWLTRDGHRARFDQQPLEANNLLEACIAAYHNSGQERWLSYTTKCFNWFLGHNDLSLPLYDKQTHGCKDGLESDKVNQNQGAESTLAWLLSLTAMHRLSDVTEFHSYSGNNKSFVNHR